MKVIAADLDRTVIPNGPAEDDNSVERLSRAIEDNELRLIYVTARNIESVERAIARYNLPHPEAVIGQVGTTLHHWNSDRFHPSEKWKKAIQANASGWNRVMIKEALDEMEELLIQDEVEQNEFKLSYTLRDYRDMERLIPLVEATVQRVAGSDAEITASADLNSGISYVDILPAGVSKYAALEFFREHSNLQREQILFAGDSENDLSVLLSDYPAVVVNNADQCVKERVGSLKVGERAYLADGSMGSNGNYGAGIVEALQKMAWIKVI